MPQMFPMPILLLMSTVSLLCLFSTLRVFWQLTEHLSASSNFESKPAAASSKPFIQAW